MKLAFVIEVSWDNGETERYGFIDSTWHGATAQADRYVKSMNKGKYMLQHEACGFLVIDIPNMFDGSKSMDGKEYEILKKTAKRLIKKTPTKL